MLTTSTDRKKAKGGTGSTSSQRQRRQHEAQEQDESSKGTSGSRSGVTHAKSGDSSDISSTEEVRFLRQQVRTAKEERNVLLNKLEWKEVQWMNKVENMEMQRKIEVEELKQQHELRLKEKLRLAEENQELKKKLEAIQKQKAELEERVKSLPSAAMSLFSMPALLRCPLRNFVGGLGASSADGGARYCQEICWRVLNAMQGVTALLCNVNDLQIVDASKSAHMTWGSSLLHGQSILTLVNGPSRAAWLRKAFQVHQQIAEMEQKETPGFVVRDLGCEEFTNKQGQIFDSSVITAHLPTEPSRGKEAAWLVIIEPQASNVKLSPVIPPGGASRGPTWNSDHRNWPPNQSASAQSEVSSINPSDSASNIFF